MAIGTTVGCGSDRALAPVISNPAQVFATVRMNHRAVTLTSPPYDTITLVVAPYNALGDPLSNNTGVVQYTSTDTMALQVSATGHVHAMKLGAQAWIRGTITRDGVTIADSALVTRPAIDPVVTGLSVAPVSPDSAKIAAGLPMQEQFKDLSSYLSGTDLSNVPVVYEIADTLSAALKVDWWYPNRNMSVATTSTGSGQVNVPIMGYIAGKTWVHVSTYIRGTTWRDSVLFTVGEPTYYAVSANKRFLEDGTFVYELSGASVIRLGVGASVSWYGGMAVVFDDSSKARPGDFFGPAAGQSGNIDQWTVDFHDFTSYSRSRVFVRPDTIQWHMPEAGVSGTLIITDERACIPNCPPFP